jgi:hypothetical protein
MDALKKVCQFQNQKNNVSNNNLAVKEFHFRVHQHIFFLNIWIVSFYLESSASNNFVILDDEYRRVEQQFYRIQFRDLPRNPV